MVTVKQVGRRYYLDGLPFERKDEARAAGCRFDGDRRCWWTGKEGVASELARAGPPVEKAPGAGDGSVPLDARVIAGRAEYKGKSYYLLVRAPRKDGSGWATKLCARDGKFSFWVPKDQPVEVLKEYRVKKSLESLRDYAEQRRKEATGEAPCPECAKHCVCGSGVFCGHCHDGCERCGRER